MTNLIWTLDKEGCLKATWNTPLMAESFAAWWVVAHAELRIVRTLVKVGLCPTALAMPQNCLSVPAS